LCIRGEWEKIRRTAQSNYADIDKTAAYTPKPAEFGSEPDSAPVPGQYLEFCSKLDRPRPTFNSSMHDFMRMAGWIALLLLLALEVSAQGFPNLHFMPLTEKDGLSSNKATAVAQDSDGIIWIGTSNGLNRYDGYGFSRFFANPADPSAISGNNIENIMADGKNNLWLTTDEGICRFNTLTHRATNFRSGPNTPAAFRTYIGSQVWLDHEQAPYISTSSGMYHFTDSIHYVRLDEGFTPFSFEERYYTSYAGIVTDRKGQLWAFQQDRLFRISAIGKKVIQTFIAPDSIFIYSIVFDRHNRCWISTWKHGIFLYDPVTQAWTRLSFELSDNLVIKGGVEWQLNGRYLMVFASNSNHLLVVDEESLQSHSYLLTTTPSGIETPLVDRQNILWIPTSNGVYFYSGSDNLFDILILNKMRKGWSRSEDESSIYNFRDEASGYWISRRYNGGIHWYDKNWKLKRSWLWLMAGCPGSFGEQFATTRKGYDFKQVGDNMFVTTEWGMLVIDLRTFKKSLYRYPSTKRVMRLRTIVPENDHTWWIRSFDQGVFVFDPLARRFTRHYSLGKSCTNCDPTYANYLLRDRRGRIFESSTTGLYQYDRLKDSFLLVEHGAGSTGNTLLDNSLSGMAEDSSGLIWIAAGNGICAFDADSGKIKRIISEKNTIGPVQRICTDDAQNIWFNSINGYWCWLRRQDKVIQFPFSMGLPDNDEGTFYKTSDGLVYGGGVRGMVRFFPQRLMTYSVTASVKIMEAIVNDTLARPTLGPSGEKTLVLRPDENNIQVNFAVINYDLSSNNLFYYKLLPGAGSWQQNENGHLSFNNLPPGEYELTVKGANKVMSGFTSTDKLVFEIKPYWYQTWWFKVVCLLLAGIVAGFVARRRIRTIRRESSFRQRLAETEMQALRAQMNPHFIFNSLSSIENFVMKNEKRLASDYLNKFARLIRMILSSSRNELVPFFIDMEALQLYVDLEQLRFRNKFCYRTHIDPALTEGDYRVPTLLIQPYVENAIVHGIAHSIKNDLVLSITVCLEGDFIHYSVEDNGIGRQKAREYNSQKETYQKSLGLKITEERIHLFNQQQNSTGMVLIVDLLDKEKRPAGTRVDIKIKAV
jgi:ligand-binding sensor domain-containing protein